MGLNVPMDIPVVNFETEDDGINYIIELMRKDPAAYDRLLSYAKFISEFNKDGD